VRGLSCAFLVSRVPESAAINPAAGWPRRLFLGLTLYRLPPAEQRLVEFLLLLPVAALVICVFRNVIGVASFGTFAPALVGLVFRDLDNWAGVGVFVGLILTGWLLRRRLDRFHLLQVPRTALLLSCIIAMLIGVVVIAGRFQIAVTKSVSLFPIIILTGMVERFWTLEEEDGVRGSFRTLAGTLLIAATVALVVSMKAVSQTLFRYPEALGLVMAGQLLLGRYTGYRLSELIRFRDVVAEEPLSVFSFRERPGRIRDLSRTDGVEHVLARRGTPAC
jgi:7 transmembrane helices usually fused to an inactive transglutaminase